LLEFPPCLKGYIVWPLPPTFEKKIKTGKNLEGRIREKEKKRKNYFSGWSYV